MKKRILSLLLAICMVLSLVPTMVFAEGDSHTVTVNAGKGGKVSTDGISWTNSVSVKVDDGETLDGKVQYKADEGYEFDCVAPKIVSVATGDSHTVLLDANGNVWTAGWNKFGQLGRDENKETYNANPTFEQVTVGNGVKIKAIAAGGSHTVLLDENGNVWTAGSNYYGQLGKDENKETNNANPTFTQVTVGDGVKIKAIAAGGHYTVLLDEEGNVWTAGRNDYGQLGIQTGSNINSTFIQVTFDIVITAIAAGGYHTVLLDEEGNVWTSGNNSNGQLGRETSYDIDARIFMQVTNGISGVKITAIAAGSDHTVLLDENNNVWTAGLNSFGQLGRETSSVDDSTFAKVTGGIGGVKITAIAARFVHTVLLDKDGNVWTAGWNNFGQLGRDENVGTDNANPTFAQPTVNPDAITFEELLNTPIYTDSVFLVKFKDVQKPVIKGLEKNKTYCDAVEFTVSDNGGIASVTANDVELTATNGKYTIAKGAGTVTVVATDNSGNTADVTVTVNNGHTGGEATCTEKAECDYCYEEYGGLDSTNHTGSMVWERNETQHKQYWNCCDVVVVDTEDHTWVDGVCSECDYICTHKDADKDHECDICGETLSDHTYEWQSENGQYWQKCSYCGDETEKKDIPAITISGADVVCKTQDYRFIITVPEGVTNVTWGYDFERMGNSGIEPTIEDGEMVGIMSSDYYASGETGFRVVAMAETADGFVFAERKSVVINSEHTDNNKDHICDICEETISDHTYEWQSENGQYWQKCSYCGDETEKKDIPAITISGADVVCKTQDYRFIITVPEGVTNVTWGYDFERMGNSGIEPTIEDGEMIGIVSSDTYASGETGFRVVVMAETADGFVFAERKSVVINSEHTDNNKDHLCDICGETLSDHTYEWQSENGQYWQKCSYCGDETEKKDIPAITIDAPNTVCKTQNCEANATIPDDITEAVLSVEFARFGGAVDITVENGMLSHIVEASTYPDDENSFNVVVYATTADGFPFEASKTVQIQDKHAGGKADCVNKAVCDTCGEEYGEADSTNHNLENIPAKAATVTETGNIEYWHCKACGKYFADENCENEIMLSDTIIAKLPPEIIDGAGQSVTEGERKELSFTSNAAYSDFVRIEIDGITLDSENYTVAEGSTVVTLNADYVAKLSVGKHTIGVVSENGTAETTFTVNAKTVDNPDTGDNSHMVLWIALAFVSGSAMLGATVAGKKKKSSAR